MSHRLAAAQLWSLKGYVALITGGGTGIGLSCAEALAAQGAKVYITGRRKEVLEQSAKVHGGDAFKDVGGSLVPLQMDQNDKEAIQRVVKKVKEDDGYLNILVNNAGIAVGRANLSKLESGDVQGLSDAMFDLDESTWDQTFQTNVRGYYYVTSAFLPLLCEANKRFGKTEIGNIINMASISGLTANSQNGQFSYNSSKSAVIQLTRLMATEFAPLGLRVNAICPGYFESEMTTGKSGDDNKSKMDKDDKRLAQVPAKRPGDENDMAMLVLDLAKNRYVTGQAVAIDGGLLSTLG